MDHSGPTSAIQSGDGDQAITAKHVINSEHDHDVGDSEPETIPDCLSEPELAPMFCENLNKIDCNL